MGSSFLTCYKPSKEVITVKRAAINLVLIPGLAVSMGTLSSSAFAQSTCSVDYRVESDWGAGATHKVLVTNTDRKSVV